MAPHFVTWADSLSTETVGEDIFGAKKRSKFELKLFFWSSPNFGQKNGLGFRLEIFHSSLH